MAKLSLSQATQRFQENDERIDAFANGDENGGYVSSGGAAVPSIRKFIAQKNTEINNGASSILAASNAARDAAQTSATNSAASAASAASTAASIASQSAILNALPTATGSSNVGFKQAGTGAVTRTVESKLRGNLIEAEDFGAVGDGISDDTSKVQDAINASVGKTLVLNGTYRITSGLSFASWTGNVIGTGSIKCQSGATIAQACNFDGAYNVNWDGVGLDMGQTNSTVTGDPRTDVGFNVKDSADCFFSNMAIKNVRVGYPFYITGTSSVAPLASHGSRRIFVHNVSCVAFPYNTIDFGAMIIVRSEFYAGDGGGIYYGASNACKRSDYTLDAAVAFARTTHDIFFSNCHFENFDRFGVLNSRDVHLSNVKLVNFYTRGFTLSPSCENISMNGGSVSGSAAQITSNYACKNLTFSNLFAGGGAPAGQQVGIRTGFGCTDVTFSNITGYGGSKTLCAVEGAKRVRFSNINLRDWPGGNTFVAVSIMGSEDGSTGAWVTEDVVFENCSFSANYGLKFDEAVSSGTVALGGLMFSGCNFSKRFQLINGTNPTGGQIRWHNSLATYTPSQAEAFDTRSFMYYEGGNLGIRMTDIYAAGGATSFPTFANVYYYTSQVTGAGADNNRNPSVQAFIKKSGQTFFQPLLYGVDWFIDGSNVNKMWNQIRMYTPTNIADGDTIAIRRLR